MTTPVAHIEKIQQAFKDLREGLAGLETFLLDWTDSAVEDDYTVTHTAAPVTAAPAEPETAPPVDESNESDSFPYTFEDVRQILGPIAKDGGKQAIQDALALVGASRLSDVDPQHYATLVDTVQKAVA